MAANKKERAVFTTFILCLLQSLQTTLEAEVRWRMAKSENRYGR